MNLAIMPKEPTWPVGIGAGLVTCSLIVGAFLVTGCGKSQWGRI